MSPTLLPDWIQSLRMLAVLNSLPAVPAVPQLKYPPQLDPKLEDAAQDLAAVMRELAGVAAEESKSADAAVAALDAAEGG